MVSGPECRPLVAILGRNGMDTSRRAPDSAPVTTGLRYLSRAAARRFRPSRALGLIIDGLLVGLPTIVLFFAVFIAWAASNSGSDQPNLASLFALLLPVQAITFGAPLLYNGLLVANGRRTVGQRVIGLQVVDATTGQMVPRPPRAASRLGGRHRVGPTHGSGVLVGAVGPRASNLA